MPHGVIPLSIPDHFETARLLIRAPRLADASELNAATLESIESLRPWMDWAQQPPPPQATEQHLREALARFLLRKDLPLHLYFKQPQGRLHLDDDTISPTSPDPSLYPGPLVGCSGLHRIDWSVPSFMIGYWCRQRFQGQGFITEAVRGIAAVAFAVLRAERVWITCDPRNERSQAVAQRAGFTLEGRLRNHVRSARGELRDSLLFAMTSTDYRSGRLGPGPHFQPVNRKTPTI